MIKTVLLLLLSGLFHTMAQSSPCPAGLATCGYPNSEPHGQICYNVTTDLCCTEAQGYDAFLIPISSGKQCCGNYSYPPSQPTAFDPKTQFCCNYYGGSAAAVCNLSTSPGVNNEKRCCGEGDAMKEAFCCDPDAECCYGGSGDNTCCKVGDTCCVPQTAPPICCGSGTVCCPLGRGGCCAMGESCCAVEGCCAVGDVCCTSGSRNGWCAKSEGDCNT